MSKGRAARAPQARNAGREPTICGAELERADLQAAKRHWESLSVNARAEALHFEDELLVQRLHGGRQALLDADLRCFALGVRGQDAVRREAGVDEFAIECFQTEGGLLRPAALFAKRCFVERSDVFELLERRLDGPFLEGRPALQRKDWPSLLEQGANSWTDFMRQILRLVELSILHIYQDAQNAATDALKVPVATAASASCSTAAVSGTQSQKRRQRKKRAGAHAAAEAADLSSARAVVSMVDPADKLALETVDVFAEDLELIKSPKQALPVVEDEPPRVAPACDDAFKKQPEANWSVEIPCMCSVEAVTPDAAAEMFAWTRNTEVFDFAKGLLPEGHRAVVRNTFLDVVVCDREPEQGNNRVRSRSL